MATALNFPNSPAINDQVTLASVIWTWDGKGWFPTGSTSVVSTSFTKIAVSGQSTINSTSTDDTLTAVAGQNITITTNPATKQLVFNATGNLSVASGFNARRQTFTANGFTSTFTLTETPTDANNLLVFVSGVQQPRSYYSLTGRNVILGGVPSSGEEIDVVDLSTGISVMGINRTIQSSTAVANQTTVSVTGGYSVGQIDIYLNGVLLYPDEYTATDGLVVTFTQPLGVADEIRIIKYTPLRVDAVDFIIKRETFTAYNGQLIFTTVNGYNTGYVDVYLNGIRLIETVDFTATDGYTVALTSSALVDDVMLVQTYYSTNSTNLTSGNLTITGNINLGQVSNIKISGGSAGQYLASNGSNGLIFTTPQRLDSGTSNIVLYNNSQLAISANGVSNAFVVGSTITSSVNITAPNVTVTGTVSAATLSATTGTVTSTLTAGNAVINQNFTANSGITTLGTAANLRIYGGAYGQVLSTDGAGNINFISPSVGITTGKSIAMAIVFGG
jgi:hypothetical protein